MKYHVISAFRCAICLRIYTYITAQLLQLPVSWFDHACLCKLCISSCCDICLEKILKYFCFYFYLSSCFLKLLLLFTQVVFFTNYFYFYSSSFESNYFYFYSSTEKSYSSQHCTCPVVIIIMRMSPSQYEM